MLFQDSDKCTSKVQTLGSYVRQAADCHIGSCPEEYYSPRGFSALAAPENHVRDSQSSPRLCAPQASSSIARLGPAPLPAP